MTTAARYWFRNSERYMTGPFTLVGVLATSWDEATALVMSNETSKPLVCMGDDLYFLSCNVVQLRAIECADPALVLVKRDEPTIKKPLASARRRAAKRNASAA